MAWTRSRPNRFRRNTLGPKYGGWGVGSNGYGEGISQPSDNSPSERAMTALAMQFPTTFIIDRDGKIAARHESVMTREALEELLKDLQ